MKAFFQIKLSNSCFISDKREVANVAGGSPENMCHIYVYVYALCMYDTGGDPADTYHNSNQPFPASC